jgi:streptogramin lyase
MKIISFFNTLISIIITIISISILLFYNEYIKGKFLENVEKENFRKSIHEIAEKIVDCLGEKNYVYYENLEKINNYDEILDCAIPEDFNYFVTIIQLPKSVNSSSQMFSSSCSWAWIVNSYNGNSISLVTGDGKEIRRHYTSTSYGDPSRTAVDYEGNVLVGNRGNSFLVKISFDTKKCKGEYGRDKNNDGKVSKDEMPNFPDGCVEHKVDLGCNNVRAVCIDKDKKSVYAGCWDGKKLFKISEDGKILNSWNLPASPYGCVVDEEGNVWISTLSSTLIELNVKENKIETFNVPFTYGIWKCKSDCIAFTTFFKGTVVLFNIREKKIVWERKVGSGSRGVFVDEKNNVYAVSSNENKIVKYDFSGNKIKEVETCSSPTGVSKDVCGYVWVVCLDGEIKIFDENLNLINSFYIPGSHYQYSDFTGFQANTEVSIEIPAEVKNISIEEKEWKFGILEKGPKIDYEETISFPIAIKYNESFITEGILKIDAFIGFLESFYNFLKNACNNKDFDASKKFKIVYPIEIEKYFDKYKICSENSCKILSCKSEIEETKIDKGEYIINLKNENGKIKISFRNF